MTKKNSVSTIKSTKTKSSSIATTDYAHILKDLKSKVSQAQTKAALAANQELLKRKYL